MSIAHTFTEHTTARPVAKPIPVAGARFQVFRAMRAMEANQPMLVTIRTPDLIVPREEWFAWLADVEFWRNPEGLRAIDVPGASHPQLVGRILITNRWCSPREEPHWMPNLRFFDLNDLGRESLQAAREWWRNLTWREKLRIRLTE